MRPADLGPVGIWSRELRFGDRQAATSAGAELEALGFGTLWIPGGDGGDVLEVVERVLEATRRVVVATGILNIWGHEPAAVAAHQCRLDREHPARFLLGLGVGHAKFVDADRPRYRRPLAAMIEFLAALEAHDPAGSTPARVVAALAPRMVELAAVRTLGVHPYLVPVEHTRWARQAVGPDRLVAPTLAVVPEHDETRARERARADLELYLGLPNYTSVWRRHGVEEHDLAGGGSDRLVERLYAWGAPDAIAARIREQHEAGADHVCLRVVTGEPMTGVDERIPLAEWRRLAAALPAAAES